MTSATAQGREGGRRQARGHRALLLLKPLFWSLDNSLHLQEGALTVTVFLFLERISITTSDLRVGLQIKTTPMMAVPPVHKWSCQGGLLVVRGKNCLFYLVCLLIF